MKRFLVILTAFVIASIPASSCIYEYREATFYPNGSQIIGKDWIVVNFTNNLPFQLYDIRLNYRGESIYIPNVAPGVNLKIDPYKTLPGQKFPIRVVANVNGGNLTYRIFNDYSRSVDVKLTIPVFDGFEKCFGCFVNEGNIIFNTSIPSGGFSEFTMQVSSNEVPDGEISFVINNSIPVRYGVDIQISVEKKQSGNDWYATFHLKNNLDRDVNTTFEAWYVINNQKNELFNTTLFLRSGENRTFFASIKNSTPPIFYIRARATIDDSCNVLIIPATKNGKSYIVGYAVLKGFKYSAVIGGGGGAGGGGVGGGAVTGGGGEVVGPPAIQPPQPQQPSPQPVPISLNLPEMTVPSIGIEEATNYVAMMLPAAYGLFFAVVIFPIMSRRGVVVTSDLINPRSFMLIRAYGRRLYSSPSNAFPGCVVIEPDEELVERFMNLGLERRYAEAIAVAIKMKKPLLTDKREVAEIAIQNGCLALPLKWA